MNPLRLHRWQPGKLARAGSELLGWFLVRAMAQAITILLLARFLGASDYGAFVAVLAISGISASIATLGLPSVVLRDGSWNPAELPDLLGQSLRVWRRSVLGFAAATSLVATIALPPMAAPGLALHAMIFAEVASVSLVELLGRAFQAQKATRTYGAMQAGLPLVRLLALAAVWTLGQHDLLTWLSAYVAASLGYSACIAWFTHARIGWRQGKQCSWAIVREGIPFTAGGVSARLQAEYNKPLLVQAAYASAGHFNVAQRAVDLVSLPILALQEALWPRLYGDADHRHRLLVAGIALVCMSLGAAAIVIVTAQLVPIALGDEFRTAARVMPWLAFLPLLAVLRSLGNFQLIATQRAYLLTRIYVIGGGAGVAFSTLLIPRHGLLGAAWACYAAEAAALITILVLLSRRRGNDHVPE